MRPTNLIFTAPNVDPGPKYRKVIAIAKQVGGDYTTVTHARGTALAVCDKTMDAYLSTLKKPEPVAPEPEPAAQPVPEPESTPVAKTSPTASAPKPKKKTNRRKSGGA